ncbi:MAG: hypothetical protein AAFU64_05955, partial [Bacteroidota bacterium]
MIQLLSFHRIRTINRDFFLFSRLTWLIIFLFFSYANIQAQDPYAHLLGKTTFGGVKFTKVEWDTCYAIPENQPSFRDVPFSNERYWQLKSEEFKSKRDYLEGIGKNNLDALRSATIIIEFGPGFSSLGPDEQAARDAFRFAADIWETEVVSSVPILIAADFANLGGGTLGSNGSPFVSNVPNAPDPNLVYTLALANAIAGIDLAPGTPNGNQTYNLNFDFYFGLDGNVPPGQVDFATVVLHEIGHSMGMTGLSNSGQGVGANGGANPAVYDIFVERGDGTPILDLGFGSTAQISALVSGDLFMNAPTAVAALGGNRPPVFAPNPFQPGSSYSHWDEASFPGGSPNSLMTPFLANQEVSRDIGNIFRGLLSDEGWQLPADIPQLDLSIIQVISPLNDSDLGADESIKVLIRNAGLVTVANFEVAYRLNGGEVMVETVFDSIPPLSQLEFTFQTGADFSDDAT